MRNVVKMDTISHTIQINQMNLTELCILMEIYIYIFNHLSVHMFNIYLTIFYNQYHRLSDATLIKFSVNIIHVIFLMSSS